MNPPSQPAPQTRAFQSWQLVFIAVMLLAAAVTSGLYIATVQAESHGAITGLTLTSDAPGTLTVSWEATSPTPTDYRVDWAKSDEDYQSWKVDDGHIYLADTATTATIADLEHDTKYKIRMRARYYRGEHEGKSWGGPWATKTITVAGEPAETPTPEPAEKEPVKKEPGQRPPRSDPPRDDPTPEDTTPAAPSLINTAVTEGQVLLSWSNPSDDSITGYQISRGPDADNLVVIEDDTESSSTSYTDTAPPAGQTHTYGVKARNASGLSPAGIATATVPAAEVLIVARHESTGNTLVSNLGQTAASTAGIIGPFGGNNVEIGMAFTTGNNPFGYHLTSAQIDMRTPVSGNTNPNFSIRADNGGIPSETILYTLTTSTAITGSWNLVTFTTGDQTTLHPNTRYWLHAANTGTTRMNLRNTDSNDEDTESNIDWQIGNNRYTRTGGTTWDQQLIGKTRMQINGHAIQQKEIIKLGGNGSINDNLAIDVGYREVSGFSTLPPRYRGYATSFTPSGDGWYYLSSIGFIIHKGDASLIRVSIHEDNSGGPADAALYVAYVPVDSETDAIPDLTATFPDNATLEAGKTYWAIFDEITGTGEFNLNLAEDSSEDAGFESWAIGDELYEIDYLAATGFTWVAVSEDILDRDYEPILMTFHGYAEPERTLVGAHGLRDTADDGPLLRFGTERITKNWLKLPMGQTFDFCEPAFVAGSGTERSWRLCDLHRDSHYDHKWAGGRGFTTGPNPTGYTITALGMDIDAQSRTLDPVADIYAAEAFSSRKGARDPHPPLASYQATAGIGGSPDRFAPRTAVSEKLHVEPGRTYVAYFQNAAAGYYQTPNARAGQDPGAEDGWTLGYPHGSKFIHPLGFAGEPWNLGNGESKRIPLNIHGWPNPLVAAPNPEPPTPAPALVSNLDKTPNTDDQIVFRQAPSDITLAYSFTTGSHGAGYSLHGVQIEVAFEVGFIVGLQATIHTDNSETPGRPGASLHELGLQTNPQLGLITFHAPADAVLEAHTTHWMVIKTADGASIASGIPRGIQLNATADAGLHACAARDWSLGSNILKKPPGISSWAITSNRLKMAILGERVSDPSVESSEPTCDDLPESTTTTGRLIVDGDGVKGQHHTQGDADWYSVDLMARTNYQFTANPGEKGLPYYTLRILDDDGAEQRNSLITAGSDGAYHGSDRRNVLPFQTDTPGTYFVSIEPRGNSSTVAYTLAMLGDDYPDSSLTRAIVDVSNNGRNFGDFHNYLMRTDANPDSSMTNDIDWIRVDLQGNATYEITYDVACLHEGEIVGIYDSDGHPTYHTGAAFQSDKKIRWCGDIKTKFTAPSDGWYFIAVTARGANFPHRDTNGLHLNKHWNPFTGVHGTLSIKVTNPPVD